MTSEIPAALDDIGAAIAVCILRLNPHLPVATLARFRHVGALGVTIKRAGLHIIRPVPMSKVIVVHDHLV
jgi:hypothetical protein